MTDGAFIRTNSVLFEVYPKNYGSDSSYSQELAYRLVITLADLTGVADSIGSLSRVAPVAVTSIAPLYISFTTELTSFSFDFAD